MPQILNYLGTYFPRSYTESYCIFTELLQTKTDYLTSDESLDILDFGCGTGGNFFGCISAILQFRPNIKSVTLYAIDGNQHALRILEKIATEYRNHTDVKIQIRTFPDTVDDFYDIDILSSVIEQTFDIIMSFKAICEFISKDCFEKNNAYAAVTRQFLPKLKPNGIFVLADITSYNKTSKEWLPRMLDSGISDANGNIILSNPGYNQSFKASHSKQKKDLSKIAWRIIRLNK